MWLDLQDDENKAVTRLKRYIALCGVRRNYKKLFEGCHSVKAKVSVLKKELEELGVEGQSSLTCILVYLSLSAKCHEIKCKLICVWSVMYV